MFQRFARASGLVVLLLAAGSLGGCKSGVRGSGHAKTETREIGELTAVKVSAGIEADVDVGPKAPLQVSGDDNVLPMVKTVVEGNTLVISFDGSVSPAVPIVVHVVTPKISALGATSSATIKATSISSDDLGVSASSAAHVTVAGTCGKLTASASSSADIDGAKLHCTSATVNATSGASIEVLASDTVIGNASSGATVTVSGHPQQNGLTSSSGGSIIAN